MGRVALLSEELVNKIAAGEVVERPASVVKELCENSVDAGARSLRVVLSGGGLGGIRIVDDGHGMSRDDARMSLQRHATSKLKDVEGLFHILTKGFRGEALPAIASVSRFSLTTSEPEAPVGTRLRVEGGGPMEVEDAPPVGGTVIQVDDLFFNTPARRKFMRRAQTELSHCEDALVRIALAHPELSVHMEHEGTVLFTSPACRKDVRERIAAALGSEAYPHLLEVEERRLGLTITGFVASPEFSFGNARGIYTFVNRRYIRDRGLNHALQRAFQEALPAGRQPVAVLFIEMDPAAVDVNVHPQKLEVRFSDGRGVYEAVVVGVSRALKGSAYFATGEQLPVAAEPVAGAHYAQAVERFLTRAQEAAWGGPLPAAPSTASPFEPASDQRAPAFGQARPGLNQAPPPGYFRSLRLMGMLARRFLVCEGSGGTLVVLDPHAALERARLETLHQLLKHGAEGAQRLLFSGTVELSAAEAKRLSLHLEVLRPLGFEIEPFGGSSFAVKSVPSPLAGVACGALVSELVSALPERVGGPREALTPLLQRLACLAARDTARELTQDEASALFEELEAVDFHRPARHGEVVVVEQTFLELQRRAST